MKLYLYKSTGRLLLLGLLLMQWSFTAGPGLPQANWTKLANRTVAFTVDHTEINIDGLQHNLTALKVKVVKGAINLHRCVVYYKDAQTQDIAVLNAIPQGGESRVIELSRTAQPVVRVVLVYDTKNRGIQQAEVELWGKNSNI
jgi:nitrate reductase NapAB chaperone NapD